jgi:peptidoglycan L-alanyl-D-glutamate endopeptidase CwlK
MPKFSLGGQVKLIQAHPDLQILFNEVIKYFDCTIICSHRGEEEQNNAFARGASKLKFPNSKHNQLPSLAVDVLPYPVVWSDTKRMNLFAGFVKGIAVMLKNEGKITHGIRWGGDWDSDTEVSDNQFNDLPHFELVK